MICARCGNNEPDGAAFCGRCGASMKGGRGPNRAPGGGRRTPDMSNAIGDLSQFGAYAQNGGWMSWLLARPVFAALGMGIVAGGVVIAAIAFAGGGGGGAKKLTNPSANGAVLLTPQAGQANGGGTNGGSNGGNNAGAAGQPTPGPNGGGAAPTPGSSDAAPTATPVPAPTATPVPQPTPVPPQPDPPTPVPQPDPPTPVPPQPQPPAPTPVPGVNTACPPLVKLAPQRLSPGGLVGLSITGGPNSVHRVGECLVLCYAAKAGQNFRLYDTATPTQFLRNGVDDGTGECLNVTITPPAGPDTIRIDALNAAGTAVIESATLSTMVNP
jgi:hypothetical protein